MSIGHTDSAMSFFLTTGYQFSRLRTQVTTNFENRINISGEAGITGNNQDPANWGPPTLIFSSGIASLSDAKAPTTATRRTVFPLPSRGTMATTMSRWAEIFEGRSSISLRSRIREGRLRLPVAATRQSDFADFLRVSRTPVPSPLATQISIFGNLFMTHI